MTKPRIEREIPDCPDCEGTGQIRPEEFNHALANLITINDSKTVNIKALDRIRGK